MKINAPLIFCFISEQIFDINYKSPVEITFVMKRTTEGGLSTKPSVLKDQFPTDKSGDNSRHQHDQADE